MQQGIGLRIANPNIQAFRITNPKGHSMLIDRDDNVIDLCEMKFASDKYEIKKGYDEKLRHKSSVFQTKTGTRKAVNIVVISTYGLTKNAYASDIQGQVVMDDLFGLG